MDLLTPLLHLLWRHHPVVCVQRYRLVRRSLHHCRSWCCRLQPACAAITVLCPTSTLWAIWMRLSSLAPLLINVDPIVALSIVALAPISTLSSITTLPICGTFWNCHLPAGQNQNHRCRLSCLHGWLRCCQFYIHDKSSHPDEWYSCCRRRHYHREKHRGII